MTTQLTHQNKTSQMDALFREIRLGVGKTIAKTLNNFSKKISPDYLNSFKISPSIRSKDEALSDFLNRIENEDTNQETSLMDNQPNLLFFDSILKETRALLIKNEQLTNDDFKYLENGTNTITTDYAEKIIIIYESIEKNINNLVSEYMKDFEDRFGSYGKESLEQYTFPVDQEFTTRDITEINIESSFSAVQDSLDVSLQTDTYKKFRDYAEILLQETKTINTSELIKENPSQNMEIDYLESQQLNTIKTELTEKILESLLIHLKI